MKLLRLVLFLVLTLTLPAIGLAGVGTASPCGMGPSDMAMPAMDCGQMSKTKAAQDGKAGYRGDCKMDAGCKTFSADPSLIGVFLLAPLPTTQTAFTQPALPVSTHNPDGLWRPPQGL
jgi:hypothetical protein